MPRTSACERRSSTVPLRHSSSFFSLTITPLLAAFKRSPCSTRRSVRIGAAVQQHVFYEDLQLGLDLFVELEHSGVHDAHVHACGDRVIQERRVHGLADLVVAPKLKEMFETPPLTLAWGRFCLIQRVALMKSNA